MMSEGSPLLVSEWLQTIKLDQYSDLFQRRDLHTVSDLRNLSDESLAAIGVILPGHRKRMLASLQKSIPLDQPVESDGFRPIPKKRNIFPKLAPEQPAPSPNFGPILSSQPLEKTNNPCSPPPIPPRFGHGPPLKFSISPPKSLSPDCFLEIVPLAEPCTPTAMIPSPIDDAGCLESVGEVVPDLAAPPLPAKRHKIERKASSNSPPPLPARPPKVIPLVPSSPPPVPEDTKVTEDLQNFSSLPAPKPLPRLLARDPPPTSVQPALREGPQNPELMDRFPGNIYELNKDIDGIVLTGFRRLKVSSSSTDNDVIENGSEEDYQVMLKIPRLDLGINLEKQYYVMHHSITHNGYLYKTSSMTRLVADRKAKEEFSRRWCVLNDGTLSYYENNHSSAPNGEIRMEEIVCVAVIPPDTHGYECTFEIYTKSERLYLFAAETPEEAREWVKSITKCFIPPMAEELLSYDFDRIGRLQFKGGRSLERTTVGWFSLCKTNLYTYIEDNDTVEVINLKKLTELSTKDKDVLVLVEKGRITYILVERKLDFSGWVGAIQKASSTSGDTLSEQQLTVLDVPCIVEKCIDHISRFGVGSEGIYRKNGQNSKITSLLEALKKDARSVVLKEDEHVDNVSDALKRFFRGIGEGVFAEHCMQWLHVTGESGRTCS
ncbi:arf-GAP with Rho-GAP domain, ANK repeat and PH domain-containing protein 1 [Pseudophryne corroboree]|uniref:arf-GAP with Rho-GAP domain, ANK repeat and PH domain-containing protein 1 n=1 Tax=Pseudophryne corroboree TaxID=495146 RepID=UPI0030812D8E